MANIITGIRILCAGAMTAFPLSSPWFYILYLAGGVSDVLDGFVARRFGQETKFGARLDTAADICFTAVVLIKLLRGVLFPTWLVLWVAGIAVLKCANVVLGIVLYKRFIAEHTVANKICGALLYAVPLGLSVLPQEISVILAAVTAFIATLAAIEEGYFVCIGKEIG